MGKEELAAGVKALRASVPSKDFAQSRAFYEALGFTARPLGPDLIEMSIGGFQFFLQDYFVKDYAENFVMHMLVDNLDAWWGHIVSLDIPTTFGISWTPRAPALQPWGMRVAFIADPSGVLWHIAERPKPA